MKILLEQKDVLIIVAALAYTIRKKRDAMCQPSHPSYPVQQKVLQDYKDVYNVMKFNRDTIVTTNRWNKHG